MTTSNITSQATATRYCYCAGRGGAGAPPSLARGQARYSVLVRGQPQQHLHPVGDPASRESPISGYLGASAAHAGLPPAPRRRSPARAANNDHYGVTDALHARGGRDLSAFLPDRRQRHSMVQHTSQRRRRAPAPSRMRRRLTRQMLQGRHSKSPQHPMLLRKTSKLAGRTRHRELAGGRSCRLGGRTFGVPPPFEGPQTHSSHALYTPIECTSLVDRVQHCWVDLKN